jgi:hypothetical protein
MSFRLTERMCDSGVQAGKPGPEQSEVAPDRNNLAALLKDTNRLGQAEPADTPCDRDR